MARVRRRVLVVSSSPKVKEFLSEVLHEDEFDPVVYMNSAGDAKRELVSSSADIAIINTPLSDEFGTELAQYLSGMTMGVILLVKGNIYDEVCCRVENYGVLTIPKPCTHQMLYVALRLASAINARLSRMEKTNQTLRDKVADIKIVNHAKWLLITELGMSEEEAHHYIEKQAMDTRLSQREISENIVRTYGK